MSTGASALQSEGDARMPETMTATKALVELKMLDKRIKQKIADSKFVSVVRGTDKRTVSLEDIDQADKDFKAAKQSIVALIARRNAIKTALVKANAAAVVTVAGRRYTLAEAIERKNSIAYDEAFLAALKAQHAAAVQTAVSHNRKVDVSLENLLKSLTEAKEANAIGKDEVETTVKAFRSLNETRLFDPINITKVIADLETEIDSFKAEVDTAISVVNAGTTIQID